MCVCMCPFKCLLKNKQAASLVIHITPVGYLCYFNYYYILYTVYVLLPAMHLIFLTFWMRSLYSCMIYTQQWLCVSALTVINESAEHTAEANVGFPQERKYIQYILSILPSMRL